LDDRIKPIRIRESPAEGEKGQAAFKFVANPFLSSIRLESEVKSPETREDDPFEAHRVHRMQRHQRP
jgi:hypothetical protein